MDFERARLMMVETQVRTNDVTDTRLLAAMRAIPRERFVRNTRESLAYADLEIEVAPQRRLMRPRDIAKLIQALAPPAQGRGLEIAGATGYGAALMSRLMGSVVALEPDAGLSFVAQAALSSIGVDNVVCVSTRAELGWAEAAPYDTILLNGSADLIPDVWLEQLAEGGKLGVIVRDGAAGSARIYTKAKGSVAYRVAFDAAPALAPGLERPASFAF